MPKLHELLSDTTIERYTDRARDALLNTIDANLRYGSKETTTTVGLPRTKWSQAPQATEAMARYVHAVMMKMPHDGPPVRAPWVKRVNANMSDLVRHLSEGIIKGQQVYQLAGELSFALQFNHLVQRQGRNAQVWLVAEWPPGFEFKFVARRDLSAREQWDMERQEARAEQLTPPPTTDVDITLLALPDPTPESVMEYVRKVFGSLNRLRKRHHELQEYAAKIEAERDEAVKQLNELRAETNPWDDVVKGIGQELRDLNQPSLSQPSLNQPEGGA